MIAAPSTRCSVGASGFGADAAFFRKRRSAECVRRGACTGGAVMQETLQ